MTADRPKSAFWAVDTEALIKALFLLLDALSASLFFVAAHARQNLAFLALTRFVSHSEHFLPGRCLSSGFSRLGRYGGGCSGTEKGQKPGQTHPFCLVGTPPHFSPK